MNDSPLPLMYTTLADWWPMISAPEDYAEEAGIYTRAILEAQPAARTLLELGSGGGNNALHMKAHFQITLVDRSPEMLAVSRQMNPDLPHHQGDMRDVRLGQTFDAVFIHDAVMYMTTQADLLAAFRTAAAHLRPGGVLLVAPDCTRETFRPGANVHGADGEELAQPVPSKAMRYLEWTYDPDPSDDTYLVEFAYLMREMTPGAPFPEVRCVHDRHVFGLFSRAVWLRLLEEAGFAAEVLPFDHSEVEGVYDLFRGVLKAPAGG